MMKLSKHLAALSLTVVLALSMTACSPKEVAKDMVIKTATMLGLRSEDGGEEEENTLRYAAAGGSVSFPEAMPSEARVNTMVQDGSLYIGFNGIQNRSTSYFVAAGDSVTITAYGETESPKETYQKYKVALWELSDDETTTSYVPESTVYVKTGGDCYTDTITGLTPGKKYKVYISYDSVRFYITGGVRVDGVGSEELTDIEGSNC